MARANPFELDPEHRAPREPAVETNERDGWLGVPLAVDLTVAASDDAIVRIPHLSVYPGAFEFPLQVIVRPGVFYEFEWTAAVLRRNRWRRAAKLPDEMLRFGVELAGGGLLVDTHERLLKRRPGYPDLAVLEAGTAGQGVEVTYLATIVPRGAALWFAAEWPAMSIPLTRARLKAAVIRDAARRARPAWEPAR
jgi:hypothetical protein